MTAQIEIAIEQIDPTSPHLPTVMALGRANTKTLGFLRDSAFVDYAKRRGILVALAPEGDCIGYVMYRCPRQQITIAHLCIDKLWRGKGVAKRLVEYLSQNHKELYGIGLWCRRDYSISKYGLKRKAGLNRRIGHSLPKQFSILFVAVTTIPSSYQPPALNFLNCHTPKVFRWECSRPSLMPSVQMTFC